MNFASLTRLLSGRPRTFRHGTHPDPHKDLTSGLAVEAMPLVPEYVLPLSQHGGTPSTPRVRPGQRVQRGEPIAAADGFRSVALHAPVSGTVRALGLRPHPLGGLSQAIVLGTDPYADQTLQRAAPCDPHDHAATLLQIQNAGIVGLGGAAYPAHAKMRLPEGKRVDVVVLNGAECEPYLTSDHRVMVEQPAAVVGGLRIIMELMGAREGRIGVEVNKPDAIEALRGACAEEPGMSVIPLSVKYPEGAKQMIIEAVAGIRVPLGGRSVDAHVTIHNVASAATIFDACRLGIPLTDRVVTVTGPGVRRPANVRVPIGTPVGALLDHCGGLLPDARHVVLGGAMMGQAQASLDTPIIKGLTGVLVLSEADPSVEPSPCIRCGACLDACPMFLNPAELAVRVRQGDTVALGAQHVSACFECGSCAYVCPSHIPLTDLMRTGKALVRKAER